MEVHSNANEACISFSFRLGKSKVYLLTDRVLGVDVAGCE